jgi:hypothetical protein
MLVNAVSCACRDVSWFRHGVSTACRFATIWLTVDETSNPCPLVGLPNEMPTLPIAWLSSLSGSSFTLIRYQQNRGPTRRYIIKSG